MEQRMGDKGRETRNREVRQKQRIGDKEQERETGNSGQETRNKDVRQGTEDGRQ